MIKALALSVILAVAALFVQAAPASADWYGYDYGYNWYTPYYTTYVAPAPAVYSVRYSPLLPYVYERAAYRATVRALQYSALGCWGLYRYC